MVESLPTMPNDDSRYQLRARIAVELRRLIESAIADQTELTFRLRAIATWQAELIINRSTLHSLRLTAIESAKSFSFPRDVRIGDVDIAGLFAGYVGQGGALAAS